MTSEDRGGTLSPNIFDENVSALRFLAVDAVDRANSGHPGTPLDIAPIVYRLFTQFLRYDADAPDWPDRDRFMLSGGHASMVLYGALHLAGFDVTLDDIKSFRRLGSRCPGHPERGLTPGVEVTTGPLGQGVANGVGFALAEAMLAARTQEVSPGLIDHRTWVTCGEGDLMEGISHEAASLAGHLGLSKLTLIYDDNRVTLDGPASWTFTEEVATRFLAYGWRVEHIYDVDNFAEVDAALRLAQQPSERPTLLIAHSHIGIGTPLHDDHRVHGAPIGKEYAGLARDYLRWPYPPFEIPAGVYDTWREGASVRRDSRLDWEKRLNELAGSDVARWLSGELPVDLVRELPTFTDEKVSTRVAGGQVLRGLAEVCPEIVGGAADVESSTETKLTPAVEHNDFGGRDIYFGIREHAMAAMTNGIAAHGGFRPFASTFFVFSDYLKPALRLTAVMQLPVVYVFTHDSIALGEDGTTHQPIEHLSALRAVPGITLYRPADGNETREAWVKALRDAKPSVLVLTRQNLPTLVSEAPIDLAGYVVRSGRDGSLIATGSEVSLAVSAAEELAKNGRDVRVVSLPSLEMFLERTAKEQEELLGPHPRLGVEAASSWGWRGLVDDMVSMETFGVSGRGDEVMAHFGFTPDAVASRFEVLKKGDSNE